MKNTESTIDAEPLQREIGLATGEIVPKNRLENQIRLASQLYLLQHPEVDFSSHETRNAIMLDWSADGEESLSKYYRDIENDSNFFIHPRLQGDILNITVNDVLYYKEHKTLPE